MTIFTASEVVAKLRERFTSGNSVPVPDVRLTRAEFDVIADLLEADEKAEPVAWVNPDDLHNPNFVGVNAVKVGHESLGKHYTLPLYTHPAPSDEERLAEALERTARHRAAADRIDPDQWRSVLYSWEDRALASHSAQAQLPINHSDEEPYPDAAKDPFWKVPGMVDTRPKAQTPATSVPGAHWFKVRAWLTDESFGYDRWKADMYSMGKGTHDAYLLIIGDVPSLGNHLKECENPLVAQENPNG